ncbi:hypothetical protein [Streptomyces hydrogenans]
MPEKKSHTPPRQIRILDEDWSDFAAAADEVGSDRATLVREFIRWYLRRPGAKLPSRPAQGGAQISA